MSASSVLTGGTPPPTPAGVGAATAVPELAERLAPEFLDVVDVDEVAARIEAAGINDRVAAGRFGHPDVFSLADAVLTHLHRDYRHQLARRAVRAAPPAPPRPYLRQALLRAALYLTPLILALAADDALRRTPWQAPAAVIVLGWGTGQLLGYLGHVVAAHRGPGPATRLLGLGFLGVAGAWLMALVSGPAWLLGEEPLITAVVTTTELAFFAAVATALVTRSEAALLRWLTPAIVAAALSMAGWLPPSPLPDDALLLALLVPGLARAWRWLPEPATGDGGRLGRIAGADLLPAAAYMTIGLAQAISFVMVWRLGPVDGSAAVALAPLVAAVPALELFIGWHSAAHAASLRARDENDERDAPRRVRRLAAAALAMPLVLGGTIAWLVLAEAASWQASALVADADRRLLLAVSAGTMLAGIFGAVLLMSARRRLAAAAALAAAPVLGSVALAGIYHDSRLDAGALPLVVLALLLSLLAGVAMAAKPEEGEDAE
ncbi:hypothetical protein [Pilimelia columellifera]|uniref:Uncharacterized protein n=1 Tax=Pilimelia columellifera subsp. columellifera TaxID=706583 RepID=A0ABP6ABP7_9ACTN